MRLPKKKESSKVVNHAICISKLLYTMLEENVEGEMEKLIKQI